MKPEVLVSTLRRLSKVGFGYDLTPEDKEALRRASNEIEDVGAYAYLARAKARESLDNPHRSEAMAEKETPSIAAYREYANRGILAVSTINSGAILAALANIDSLRGLDGVAVAFQAWTIGLAAATACWLFAYLANAAYAHDQGAHNHIISTLGVLSFVLSLASFVWGAWEISTAFSAEAEAMLCR